MTTANIIITDAVETVIANSSKDLAISMEKALERMETQASTAEAGQTIMVTLPMRRKRSKLQVKITARSGDVVVSLPFEAEV